MTPLWQHWVLLNPHARDLLGDTYSSFEGAVKCKREWVTPSASSCILQIAAGWSHLSLTVTWSFRYLCVAWRLYEVIIVTRTKNVLVVYVLCLVPITWNHSILAKKCGTYFYRRVLEKKKRKKKVCRCDQDHCCKTILEKRQVLAVNFGILRTVRKFCAYLINSSKCTCPANGALLAKCVQVRRQVYGESSQ